MCKQTFKSLTLFEIFKKEQNFINIGVGNVLRTVLTVCACVYMIQKQPYFTL